jgi:hypothetical protein
VGRESHGLSGGRADRNAQRDPAYRAGAIAIAIAIGASPSAASERDLSSASTDAATATV